MGYSPDRTSGGSPKRRYNRGPFPSLYGQRQLALIMVTVVAVAEAHTEENRQVLVMVEDLAQGSERN